MVNLGLVQALPRVRPGNLTSTSRTTPSLHPPLLLAPRRRAGDSIRELAITQAAIAPTLTHASRAAAQLMGRSTVPIERRSTREKDAPPSLNLGTSPVAPLATTNTESPLSG